MAQSNSKPRRSRTHRKKSMEIEATPKQEVQPAVDESWPMVNESTAEKFEESVTLEEVAEVEPVVSAEPMAFEPVRERKPKPPVVEAEPILYGSQRFRARKARNKG